MNLVKLRYIGQQEKGYKDICKIILNNMKQEDISIKATATS
jgi:hypothetical protein